MKEHLIVLDYVCGYILSGFQIPGATYLVNYHRHSGCSAVFNWMETEDHLPVL